MKPAEPRTAPTAGQADWPALWQQALHRVDERRARRAVRAWAAPLPLAAAHAELLSLYEPILQRGSDAPPWVIAHLGQSLDGYIATRNGDSRFVTGEQDLDHMHRLRALCDAVVVGAGTVAIDDPLLTTRRVPGRHPVRVVLDPMRRVPPGARVLHDDEAPTLHLVDERWRDPSSDPSSATSDAHVQPCALSASRLLVLRGLLDAAGRLDAAVALAALVAEGLRVIFVEGGGVTVSRFLAQGLLDRLHLTMAPVLIGQGRRGLHLPANGTMADCPRLHGRVVRLGDDQLWDLDLSRSRPAEPIEPAG